MVGFTGVLAHQGGWDEVLLVAAPVVVFVLLLRFANQRARRMDPTLVPGAEPPDTPDASDARGDAGDAGSASDSGSAGPTDGDRADT